MAVEVRPANAEEMEQYHFINRTVFAEDAETRGRESIWREIDPAWTLCAFEDGAMATSYATFPFTQKLAGADVPVAAVTGVGTLPHQRRRGYLRACIEEGFRRYRDAGLGLAILTASLGAIYQRFGYAITSMRAEVEVDPTEIRFASGPRPSGTVRLTDRPDQALLEGLYARYIAAKTGPILRDDLIWRTQTLDEQDKKIAGVYVAVYEEAGEPLGYAVYDTREHDYGDRAERWQKLTLRELVWLTAPAYVALWEHVASHDLAKSIAWLRAHEDDPLFYLLEEPRRAAPQWHDDVLTRVVDVPLALASRPYGGAASLRFAVVDARCDWNAGVWELETDGERSEVRRSGGAPQLTLPVHSLASLVTGALSASELAELGRVEVADHASLGEWDRTFAIAGRPFILNDF